MRLDRVAHIGVFLARAREQLQRQDIGVGVDDAPGHDRARFRHLDRGVAHARHEDAQQDRVACEPDQDRQRQPEIGRGQQQHRAGAVDQDVPDRRDHRDQALADRRPGLHHLVGDTAGEIVLEEGPALPHHMPVALPADQVGDIGRDALIGNDVLRGQRQRTQHDQHHRHPEQQVPGLREQGGRVARCDEGHDAADEDRNGDVEQSDDEAGHEQRGEQPFRLARKMPVEGSQRRRRLRVVRQHRRLQRLFKPLKHETSKNGKGGAAAPPGSIAILSNAGR